MKVSAIFLALLYVAGTTMAQTTTAPDPTPTTSTPKPTPAASTPTATTPAPQGKPTPAPSTPAGSCWKVSVERDATYCVSGPICSGRGDRAAGTNCPKKGDVATADCRKNLKSYVDFDRCVAPVDAECRVIKTGAWGCVWKDAGNEPKPTPAASVPSPTPTPAKSTPNNSTPAPNGTTPAPTNTTPGQTTPAPTGTTPAPTTKAPVTVLTATSMSAVSTSGAAASTGSSSSAVVAVIAVLAAVVGVVASAVMYRRWKTHKQEVADLEASINTPSTTTANAPAHMAPQTPPSDTRQFFSGNI